jgi:hypothetical protein
MGAAVQMPCLPAAAAAAGACQCMLQAARAYHVRAAMIDWPVAISGDMRLLAPQVFNHLFVTDLHDGTRFVCAAL